MSRLTGWYSDMRTVRLSEMSERERQAILSRADADLTSAVRAAKRIIEDVRVGGDDALARYARELDGWTGDQLTLDRAEIRKALDAVPSELLRALRLSARRIRAFHSRQVLKGFEFRDEFGLYGQRVVPLDRVGVYVPGGTAAYMSTVLMACIPASIAGVREIAMFTPGRAGQVPPGVLAAAEICGVEEVHPVGGAHAIAAMTYGTESLRRVQKIVGPGGAFVAAAKMLVRNDCEIDSVAGPSEVLILADSSASAELIAADMLAQLEHDPLATAVLVSTSDRVLESARRALQRKIPQAPRSRIIRSSASRNALFISADTLREAVDFANEYAPEHLLIDVKDPRKLLPSVRSAGSVFLGPLSSVAFGDYCSGTNHILPTKGTARMRSGLSVYDFLKVIPYQQISPRGAAELSKAVEVMARAEGLPGHAEAAVMRSRRISG